MSKPYDENDGMFSEHLVLISSISVSNLNIKRVLEVGTHDGRTALILSRLFLRQKLLLSTCRAMKKASKKPIVEITQSMSLQIKEIT